MSADQLQTPPVVSQMLLPLNLDPILILGPILVPQVPDQFNHPQLLFVSPVIQHPPVQFNLPLLPLSPPHNPNNAKQASSHKVLRWKAPATPATGGTSCSPTSPPSRVHMGMGPWLSATRAAAAHPHPWTTSPMSATSTSSG
ncbi:hypothetical protein FRC03_012940 [Tulasnella sp. 419]|nr:hypothetical protein FRC03_012940 [Tulasnella sp. 419]